MRRCGGAGPRPWRRRRRARSGWSLVEVTVCLGLAALVMLVVTNTLISTSRITRAQNQRAMRQAGLQAIMRHLEVTLRSSLVAAVSWQRSTSPDAAILAAQCQQPGFITTTPRLQTRWRCFLWDAANRKLYMGDSLAAGGFAAPPESKAQMMAPAQMTAILARELPPSGNLLEGRPISDRVTELKYSLEEGPLFKVEVELDVPPNDRGDSSDALERLRASVLIHPRNRN
jgi:hypothetical protein